MGTGGLNTRRPFHSSMWKKLGLVFSAKGQFDWMRSHAAVPTPLHIGGDRYRVFFSTRDSLSRSQVGFVEIDLNRPQDILAISEKPVLPIGDLGHFDCDGVYGTSLVRFGDELRFYYAGWNAGLRGVFYSAIGFATSTDGLAFKKHPAPVMQRDVFDPWFCAAPFVLRYKDFWAMWYVSGLRLWHVPNEMDQEIRSTYTVKSAHSRDGVHWVRTDLVTLDLGEDTNIARCCVLNDDGRLKAWYPYVGKSGQYRIGYGEGEMYIRFDRKDSEAGIDVGDGWESDAVTYPYVFRHKGREYMLYNGNGFGRTGFGLAVR